jgi:hypothetical protein
VYSSLKKGDFLPPNPQRCSRTIVGAEIFRSEIVQHFRTSDEIHWRIGHHPHSLLAIDKTPVHSVLAGYVRLAKYVCDSILMEPSFPEGGSSCFIVVINTLPFV